LNLTATDAGKKQVAAQARNAKWGANYDNTKGWFGKKWEKKQALLFFDTCVCVDVIWVFSTAGVLLAAQG